MKEVDPLLTNNTRNQTESGTESSKKAKIQITIHPETFRVYAYLLFWAMCAIAKLLTKYVVRDRLLKGLPDDAPACPPFQHHPRGFDIDTDSHLMQVFGFNNICVNWDYSPSREITAILYPVFEYALLIYLVADFVAIALAYREGLVSPLFWRISYCAFPITILLCSWFRMIFVVIAYEDVRGHTAGFLGLQLVLMTVACLNVGYIIESRKAYDMLGGQQGTKFWAIVYLVTNLSVSLLKYWLDANVVFGKSYPDWGKMQVLGGSLIVGKLVDYVWMLFNAMLPLAIAYVRSKSDQPLEISLDMLPPKSTLETIGKDKKEDASVQP